MESSLEPISLPQGNLEDMTGIQLLELKSKIDNAIQAYKDELATLNNEYNGTEDLDVNLISSLEEAERWHLDLTPDQKELQKLLFNRKEIERKSNLVVENIEKLTNHYKSTLERIELLTTLNRPLSKSVLEFIENMDLDLDTDE